MGLSRDNIPNMPKVAFSDEFSAFMSIIKSYAINNIDTILAVEVISVNGSYVDVKSLTERLSTNGDILENPIYHNIPVMSIIGADIEISLNVAVGNKGLLIANKWDITNYKNNHKTSPIGSNRTFDYSNGFYLPLDFGNVFEGINLRKGNSSLQITENSVIVNTQTVDINANTANINASSVNLGGDGGIEVARVGDSVDLSTGKIITGSSVVKAL